MADPIRLRVATFNIRNTNDRYEERKPLLGRAFAEIGAQIAGLQEVVFGDDQQADFLASTVPDSGFMAFDARSARDAEFGNAILCRVGDVQVHEELRLSRGRVAHRILVLLPRNRTLWFANAHLHHVHSEAHVRHEQSKALVEWLADAPRADAMVVAGDFNATPDEPAYRTMEAADFRSAFREAHGQEPAYTRPSGIQAPTADPEAPRTCVDYLWVAGEVVVESVGLAANQPDPGDSTLYPSDHFAVRADLALR